MRHGPCLLKRRERFHMQVLLGPTLGILPVHSKRLGGNIVLCLFGSGHWNLSSQIRQEPNYLLSASNSGGPMSNEKPTDDPRQQTDWGSHKQTDKPWKGNPEKEQRPGSSKPDLEKWHETNTH